ncbi:MAG TPA: outer membrane beta-barrel protein [Chryseolinea sp.]
MKYFIAAILLLGSIQCSAQFNKGDKVLGGTFGFNTAKSENNQYTPMTSGNSSFGIYPNFGILVNSNLEIGGQLGYTWSRDEWDAVGGSNDRKSNSWTARLYTQRYFMISDKFLFSLVGSISYGWSKEKTSMTNQIETIEQENKWTNFGFAVTPTFIFFPSPNWAVQASIGNLNYTHSKNTTTDDASNSFGMNYGSLGFGLAYYFRGEVD